MSAPTAEWRLVDREDARREFLAAMGRQEHSSPPHPTMPWTYLVHPLALAVLELRAPGLAWRHDPFADPEIAGSCPVVWWEGGSVRVYDLAMPRSLADAPPMAGCGIDGGFTALAAWWATCDPSDGARVSIEGVMPDGLMSALAGRPLREVTDLPPCADPALAKAVDDLVVDCAWHDGTFTTMRLLPTRWVAPAAVPSPLPSDVDTSFLLIDCVR